MQTASFVKFSFSLASLLVFGALALSALFSLSTEVTAPVVSNGPDWEQSDQEDGIGLLSYSFSSWGSGWKTISPNNFNLPDFPDGCKTVEELTGKPCKWEIETKNNEMVTIKLKSGDHTIVDAQGMRINLSETPQLPSSFGGSQYGWVSSIKVANWVQGMGFGKLGWSAFDSIVKCISYNKFGEAPVRVFFDVSKVGWGESLLKNIPVIQKITDRMWIYKIP